MEAQTKAMEADSMRLRMTLSDSVDPIIVRDLDSGKTMALSEANGSVRMGAMKAPGVRGFSGLRGFFSGKRK